MEKLKIAILGIGNIGEYHAREFNNSGCEVIAILTSSEKSSKEKSEKLKELYGINANPYWDLDELLEKEKVDIVSVCTPAKFHYSQIKKCLNKNIHVLSEKPLIFNSNSDNYDASKELFNLAKSKQKILSCNTQLVSLLKGIPTHLTSEINYFSIYMEPPWEDNIKLVTDAIPHMNSFLIKLLGENQLDNLKFIPKKEGGITISFNYGKCEIKYDFGINKQRPRKFYFNINGIQFEKKTSEDYQQKLIFNGNNLDIEDPLTISINLFINACKGLGNSLVIENEILQNIKLQDLIIKKLIENNNSN
ncbi:MAG: Gfo/Idh/MocA family oxidoreductase [Nanoarchaeota archaeon]|nr:Gfo/Idh/MocA family oxidoreductase [Nanoarchaeota archaeon]